MTRNGLWAAALVLAGAGAVLAPVDGRAVLLPTLLPVAVIGLWAVRRPAVVLTVLVAMPLSNVASVLSDQGVPATFRLVAAVAAVTVVVGLRSGQLRIPGSPVWLAVILVLVAFSASVVVAEDRATALATVLDAVEATVFMSLVAVLATVRNGVVVLVRTAVATLAVVCLLSVLQEFVLSTPHEMWGMARTSQGDEGSLAERYSGPFEDPNFWGRVLVLFLPLAAVGHRLGWPRPLVVCAVFAMLGGIYLTGSRGTFIAAGVALIVWLLAEGKRHRRYLWLAPLVGLAVFALPGVGSRLQTVLEVGTAASGGGDPSLVGRVAAQQLALRMLSDRPVLGVGVGNFLEAQGAYQSQDPTFTDRAIAPHNLYLGLAAEVGLVGLLVWVAFFLTVVWLVVVLLRRRDACAHRLGSEWLPRELAVAPALLGGLVAWSLASVFVHLADLRLLLLLVAMVLVAEERTRSLPRTPVDVEALRRRVVPVLAGAAAAALASGAAALSLPLTEQRFEATTSAVVQERGARPDAYQHAVAGRSVVLRSYAAVLDDRAAAVASAADGVYTTAADVVPRVRAVRLHVVADDSSVARRVTESAADQGSATLRSTGAVFQLGEWQPVTITPVVQVRTEGAAFVVALSMAVGAAVWARVRHAVSGSVRTVAGTGAGGHMLQGSAVGGKREP